MPIPDKFPSLFERRLEGLGLHPKAVSGDGELAAATKRVLGGLQQIGLGINELRNEHGTGHAGELAVEAGSAPRPIGGRVAV